MVDLKRLLVPVATGAIGAKLSLMAKEKEQENIFLEEQKQEIEDGKKDITCAAVNKQGERCSMKVDGKGNYCTIHQKVDQRADGKKVQCKQIKSNGDRCKMKTSSKSGLCYYHD